MDTGRWTILSRATPQPRRPSQQYLRARVHVRCVCGVERIVWLEDIEQKRSTGCESRRCSGRFRASRDMRDMLTQWIELERLRLLAVSRVLPHRSRKEFERVALEVCTDRLAGLDRAIASWLLTQADNDIQHELAAVAHA
jgi:hypothetical protein